MKVKTRYGYVDMSEITIITNLDQNIGDWQYGDLFFTLINYYGDVILKINTFNKISDIEVSESIKNSGVTMTPHIEQDITYTHKKRIAKEHYEEFVQQWLDNK